MALSIEPSPLSGLNPKRASIQFMGIPRRVDQRLHDKRSSHMLIPPEGNKQRSGIGIARLLRFLKCVSGSEKGVVHRHPRAHGQVVAPLLIGRTPAASRRKNMVLRRGQETHYMAGFHVPAAHHV